MNLEHPWSMWISSLPKIPNPKQVLVLFNIHYPVILRILCLFLFSAPHFLGIGKCRIIITNGSNATRSSIPLGAPEWIHFAPAQVASLRVASALAAANGNGRPHGLHLEISRDFKPWGKSHRLNSNLKWGCFQDHPIESVGMMVSSWLYLELLYIIHPRKIDMEPKNHPIEKENHLPNHHFQVPC